MPYTHADGTQECEYDRAKRLADMLYDKLVEKGLSHDEAILAMEKLYDSMIAVLNSH